MLAMSQFALVSEEIFQQEHPTHAAGSDQTDEQRFFSFELSAEKKSEAKKLLCAFLCGEYDSASLQENKGFCRAPKAVPAPPRSRGALQQLNLEHVDFTFQQPSATDSELTDDEFSEDEYTDDDIDEGLMEGVLN
jgi:hypothetical protein